MGRQLDLFDDERKTEIIIFPMSGRIAKIRHVRTVFLRQKTDAARSTYWKRVGDDMFRSLKRIGVPDDLANRCTGEFMDECRKAIEHEYLLETYRGRRDQAE